MRNVLFVIVFSLFSLGCESAPKVPTPPKTYQGIHFANDCLPKAVMMQRGLEKYDIPSKVLVMSFSNGQGHAVTVYLYPDPDVLWRVWVWDEYWGSVRIVANFSDSRGIAQQWLDRYGFRSLQSPTLVSSTFLE